jgi:hypothetical protein
VALRQVASIFHAQGQSSEALKILREEVLPVFERMGAKLEHEATERQIGKILAGS